MEDTYGNLIASLAKANDKRIVLLVMDGLGDCDNAGKGTALAIARKVNMNKLATTSALGLLAPVANAVTPGSGPGHIGLFGYDPLVYQVGRGVLSALGVEFPLTRRDVAARLNFCTIGPDGKVADRRAGRIPDEENRRVVAKILKKLVRPNGIEVFIVTEAEHRAVMVLRSTDPEWIMDENNPLSDTDPQETGLPPLPVAHPRFMHRGAQHVTNILHQIGQILADEPKANMILARGFAKVPCWPTFAERFKMNPAAVAGYPMYRGVATLFGMPVVARPTTAADVCSEAAKAMKDHTFVFAHFKYTDKTGEDGDLDGKVKRIEEMDAALPALLAARPDVLIITGDHSTPPSLMAHSWHPVPVLMSAPHLRGGDGESFDEVNCRRGQIGTIPSKEIIPLAMAHAGKLEKFGA
jgi:2,3-bisphosphoglycerate-independent phosphoglycerate mutase